MDNDAKVFLPTEDRLPRDWDAKYSKRLVQGYINACWEDWPKDNAARICREHYVDKPTEESDNILSGQATELSLAQGYHYFNKTAVLYLASGGDPKVHWKINDIRFPAYWDQWLVNAYEMWHGSCQPRETWDARFVFATRHFAEQDDVRMRAWIGLGDPSAPPPRQDIEGLIRWHVQHCDFIQARAGAHVSPDDESQMEEWEGWSCESLGWRAKAYHSRLAPTCRAVLLIGRNPMPAATQNVLLVLTGHNIDMLSGPPTFDSIPSEQIVAARSSNIMEVSLQTAVNYLQLLERKEEAVNDAFREKNDARKEAIYEDARRRAHLELESLREYFGVGGRRTRRGRKRIRRSIKLTRGILDFAMDAAWKAIVAEERQCAILLLTAELRQSMQAEDLQTPGIHYCR